MKRTQPALASRESNDAPAGWAAALPNALSVSRLVLALAFPWLPSGWRLGAVVAGAASDLLDGLLSRRLHATSAAGRLLDPVADKLFVFSVVGTLWWQEQIALWQLALVGIRDLATLAGSAWMFLREGWAARGEMTPKFSGKITTAVQFVFLLSVLYYETVMHSLFAITVVCSCWAAVDYVTRYARGSA